MSAPNVVLELLQISYETVRTTYPFQKTSAVRTYPYMGHFMYKYSNINVLYTSYNYFELTWNAM